jgi:hypothetical protein
MAVVLWLTGCGPAAPPPRQKPPGPDRSALRLGQPVPETIRATRMFTVKPSDRALAEMCRQAATGVPLVYTCGACQREARAAVRKRIATFRRWVGVLKANARVRKPAQIAKLYAKHGAPLGMQLSRAAFVRLRAAPPAELTAAFEAMVREGIGPYIIDERGPLEEAARSKKVILRVGRSGKGGRDVEVDAGEIKALRPVAAELKRLAAEHGAKLPPPVREDLAAIAASGLAATVTIDKERTLAGQAEAVKQAKATRMSFNKGDEVIKKGEEYTLVHRQILQEMDAIRCEPCTGGLARCGLGPMRRVRAGAMTRHAIRATRDFIVPAVPGLQDALKNQAADDVARVFTVDGSVGRVREDKVGRLFDRAARAGKDRWKKLRDDLESKLQVKVILQLLQHLDGVPPRKAREAVLDLYARAQAEPIIAAAAPRPTEACTLRRTAGRRVTEETSKSCNIVPLPRLRLQLPKLATDLSDRISKLPLQVQQAVVGLVQELLVANTTPDPDETERRRKKAAEGVTGSARQYRVGDVVVEPNSQLTQADIYVLEQMYAVHCADLSR